MTTTPPATTTRRDVYVHYDAFVSYSHAADGRLAPRLQQGLHALGKPWYRRRALRVFRDKTSLTATPELWDSIVRALESARFLVLLASPQAAASGWVGQEVEWWLTHRSPEQLLIVLTDGELHWDNDASDFDRTGTTALPDVLHGAFRQEPLWVDLRWARTEEQVSRRNPRFQDAVADLAAPIHGVPKDDLLGEDVRQHRRALLLARGAVVALVLLLVGVGTAGVVAVQQARIARQEARVALSRQLGAQARSLLDGRPETALLLALEGVRNAKTTEAVAVLQDGLTRPHHVARELAHETSVHDVAFSPDGKTLASGGADMVQLWDMSGRRPLGQLRTREGTLGPRSETAEVAFSPDGKTLASSASESTLQLWDVRSGRALGQPLRGHQKGYVWDVAFSPDGKTLASAGSDNTVRLWDVTTHRALGEPLRHRSSDVAFSPDGTILASAGFDGTVQLWDVRTRQALGQPLRGHKDQVNAVAFSPDGTTLASAGADSTVRLWSVRSGRALGQPLRGHDNRVEDVAFSPDGTTLASTSWDGTVQLWDVSARKALGEPLRGHQGIVYGVAFSPDGNTLASGSNDGTVRLWEMDTRQALGQPLRGHEDAVWGVAVSPDSKVLASASCDATVRLWDVNSGRALGPPLRGHDHPWCVTRVAFSPDGKLLASASRDKTVRLWDVRTRRALGQPLRGHGHLHGASNVRWGEGFVNDVAFSPDGTTLASAGADRTVRLWDVRTRRALGEPLRGHQDEVRNVAFSPDGAILASASFDGIRLWDVRTRRVLSEPLRGHGVAFSPDGATLASASSDGIRLWDVRTRRALGQPLSNESATLRVAFSPNGTTLATASGSTVRLWDVRTRRVLGQPLRGHDRQWDLKDIAFSPDGKTLATASDDYTVRLWRLTAEFWVAEICRLAGRNLSQSEWSGFVGDNRPYVRTCPGLPSGRGAPPDAPIARYEGNVTWLTSLL